MTTRISKGLTTCAVALASISAQAMDVGLLMGGAKAHNNEFDEAFEKLGWTVSRYEGTVEGIKRFTAEADKLDMVFTPPLFNWNGGSKWLLPEDVVDYAAIRRYIENGGMFVVTEAQYVQVHGFFEKVDKSFAVKTGNCTSSPWQVLGYTRNEEPVHPMRCFPNPLSEADSWSHFVEPEKDGWTVLSRCSEGNPVVICREFGKGLVVYTALRQRRLAFLENYGAYNLLRKLGLKVTKFSAPALDIGDGRIEIELGEEPPAGAQLVYEIRGEGKTDRFSTKLVGRAAALDFTVARRGEITAALILQLEKQAVSLFERKGTIPPLFQMQPNWYRGMISTKRRVKTVDFKAEFAPDKEDFSMCPISLVVFDAASKKVAEAEHVLPTNDVPRELWLPVPLDQSLPAGGYRIVGTVKLANGRKITSETTFKIVPPHPSQVMADDDGTLLENGKPFFPIGIYHVSIDDIPTIADLGFNSMQFWNWQIGDWFDHIPTGYYRAGSYGLRSLFEGVRPRDETVKKILRDGVSTLGWYVADEPDEHAEAAIRDTYNYWRTFDSEHPAYICSCRPDLFHIHQKYCDILSFDPGGKSGKTYHETVVDWIKAAQKATQGHKTIGVTPGCGNKRENANFYRGVYYLSLVHNVRAMMWYCWYQIGGGPIGVGLKNNETPGVKEMFRELNSEAKVMMPGLLAVNRRTFEYGDVHGMMCGDGARNQNFLILVNISDKPASCDFTLPEIEKFRNFKVKMPFSPENTPKLDKEGKVLMDKRARRPQVNEKIVNIQNGRIAHEFGPYETLVYRW